MSPRFSIITPVYNTNTRHLEQCIASVVDQSFGDWELCLVDDRSTRRRVRQVLEYAAEIDDRVRVAYRSENGGIVAASNDGLAMAKGDFVVLLDHDDVLEPDALELVDRLLASDPEIDYVYTDETLMTEKGRVIERFHKPDWSPERFRHQMYVCHLSTIRRKLILDVGGFHEGFDGAQDYDLVLRVTERARKIGHVPKLLYHWRMAASSVANNASAKPYAYDAGKRAIEAHLERTGSSASVERLKDFPGNYHIVRHREEASRIDVFVPDSGATSNVWGVERHDHRETVSSLLQNPGLSVTLTSVRGLGAKALNDAMKLSDANVMVVASESLEPAVDGWASKLVLPLEEPGVGLVSGVTYTANSRLQHAGFYLHGSFVESALFRLGRDNRGQRAILETTFEVSAVDWQCLAIKRSVFEELGGFDETLEHPWVVIDFCLRAAEIGITTLVCSQAEFFEFSSNDDFARRRTRAPKLFRKKWQILFDNDPFRPKPPLRLSAEDQRPFWRPRRLRDLKNCG